MLPPPEDEDLGGWGLREPRDDWREHEMTKPVSAPIFVAPPTPQADPMQSREEALEQALRAILKATKSHVDGRDLLDELHPRHTIDIKVRRDGQNYWFEGDWLSNLRTAIKAASVVLDTVPSPPEVPRCLTPEEFEHRMNLLKKESEGSADRLALLGNHFKNVAENLESPRPVYTVEALRAKLQQNSPPPKRRAVHQLKCWPQFFSEIRAGRKRHDLRRNDRDFQVGDMIELWEFDPTPGEGFTGLTQDVRITYITSADSPCAYSEIGLQPGFAILSITTDVEGDE